ncbi:pyridoxamine 5'-phosphate oxidase family protein [Peptoniphilus sp. KCTC 25270]|uniref:pyridoxamine 5'-phosphate oxidase family protein n=1 Tax=Peptoniphilus sp. KCTC 25270 TaxID=2897414 RepID=UPI001E603C65|nr:pyridoxamine 5'-phosphate oxidase family protein [Peptoniphilus sp. KCTC 25270]MCD1147677.1 pyridoxamine 5'-phosphate oxidase family protein [Peptoniphilus sp. KCTC 25270]
MFREMRRSRQILPEEKVQEILERGTNGILSVIGEDGYPYGVPISYAYEEGKIYFHSAKKGHKNDAIKKDSKVSFTVVDQDEIVPEKFTTYFRSVIGFGKARLLEGEELYHALDILGEKYWPGHIEERKEEIKGSLDAVACYEISFDHIMGKEAIELVRMAEPKGE